MFNSNRAKPHVVSDTLKERRTATRSVGLVKTGRREFKLVEDRSV